MGTKTCTKCKQEKVLAEFTKSKDCKGGRCPRCTACASKQRKEYRSQNPLVRERRNQRQREYRKKHKEQSKRWDRKFNLKRSFNITPEDYEKMLESQNGVCAICEGPEKMTLRGKVKRLSIDHDHKTGVIRGLLCSACNTRLVHLEDIDLIIKSRIYLAKFTPEKHERPHF